MVVVEVGETRTAQCPPGDRPGVQNEPDSREARPRPRAHGTPGLSLLTDMALIGCNHASLSSRGTSACLHKP